MTIYLTISEVAAELRISESMVRKLITTGRIIATHFGRRVLVAEEDLSAFKLASRRKGAVPAGASR